MFEPLRFFHVADAGLDLPLGDLESLPDTLQILAEEATLIAFDQMIEGAVSQNVDCVLLAGNTFREQDHSLRARLKLLDGFRELNEHGISVFVLPGPHDPESAWRNMPDLPGNVTVLTSSDSGGEESEIPVAIIREGRVIATITAGMLSQLSAESKTAPVPNSDTVGPACSQNGHARSMPFRIGMLTAWPVESLPPHPPGNELADQLSACGCDYLAVPSSDPSARQAGWNFEPGQTLNTRDGIAHHPGPLQARSANQTGPHGATLIEVDKAGEIRGTFLPFAAARRLRFELPVEPNAALEDIAEALGSLLEAETVQAGERGWFAIWRLQGSGKFFDSFRDPFLQTKLIDALPKAHPRNTELQIHHQLIFQESPPLFGDEDSCPLLERLYAEALDTSWANDLECLHELSQAMLSDLQNLENPYWEEQLETLVAELDSQDVMAKARLLGREWFRDPVDD